jgi:hypothetical protein
MTRKDYSSTQRSKLLTAQAEPVVSKNSSSPGRGKNSKTNRMQDCNELAAQPHMSSALEKADRGALQPNEAAPFSAADARKLISVSPEQLRAAFLTDDPILLVPLLAQSTLTSHVGEVQDPLTDLGTYLYVARTMESLGPRDGQERFLAMQMLATHTLAMESLALTGDKDQTNVGREMHLNLAVKLLRLYTTQMEAWKQHRSNGEQRCTVEHVHVHSGAQAVVGTINQNLATISNSEERGKKEKSGGDQ